MASIKSKNLLITGGTGLVGSHLIEKLLQYSPQKIVVTQRSINYRSYFYSKKLHKFVTQVCVDLKNFTRVKEIISKYKIDYIFHLGAQPIVDIAIVNPLETLETNIRGTYHILEAARQLQSIKGIIIASSDKAYGKMTSKNRYNEKDSLRGDHPYEVSKSAADLIAQMYIKTYHLPVVITRFANIYGPGDENFDRLIPDICRSIIKKRTLKIRSDGTFCRDYLYVVDVVSGYMKIIEHFNHVKGEVFNFGSLENLSVLAVIKTCQRTLHQKMRHKILKIEKNEIPFQSLNFSKAKKILHWSPHYQLRQTIKTTYDWYKQYFKNETD